jgi:hypothetical protein
LPRQDIASGDTCKAQASIVFDINPAIATNTWTNIVDAIAPQSKLKALPKTSPANTILLEWTAADDPKGSGLAHYGLYVSKNEGPFYLHQADIDTTFFLFAGEPLSKYAYYIRAEDNVGNREAPKTLPEAITTLGVVGSLALASPRVGSTYCAGDTLYIQWQASNAGERFALYYSVDDGKTFSLIKTDVGNGNNFAWPIPLNINGSNDAVIQIRSLDDDRFVANSGKFSLYSIPVVDLGKDVQLMPGDSVMLSSKGANWAKYQWSTGASTSTIIVKTPGEYVLSVTDQNGCKGQGHIKVSRSVNTIEPGYVESFNLYPNPANEGLNIQFSLRQAAHLSWHIQDTQGKTVQQGTIGKFLHSSNVVHHIEIAALPSGNYLFIIQSENRRVATAQFLKTSK